MSVNLNKSEDFVKEFKVFNDGKAGIADNVRVRVDKKPVYKLVASDDKGEINEGFFYQEPDSDGFTKYQAQRLIQLARGVFGDDVKFPEFSTPKEALDGVMKMVAPELAKKVWRVAVCYGTNRRKASYLGFKSFGSFIQPMTEENTLSLATSDSTTRAPLKEAAAASDLVSGMNTGSGESLDWMKQ
jgi:hypothetical protein